MWPTKLLLILSNLHCLIAILEGIAYAIAAVVVRFSHDKIWTCYIALMLLQFLTAAVLGGF